MWINCDEMVVHQISFPETGEELSKYRLGIKILNASL